MNDKIDDYRDKSVNMPEPEGKGGIADYGRRAFSSFRNPVYRLYYYSMVGHWGPIQMQMVTRTLLVYRITNSGTLLGFVALANFMPSMVLSLYGGVLADRVDKRKLLIISHFVSAAVVLGLALALSFNYISQDVPGSWWVLIVAGIFEGIIMGIVLPSRVSYIAEIVRPDELMNAISLNNMGMNAFRILAPAAAGFIINAWDFAAVYYIMTGLLLFSVIFLFLMPSVPSVLRQGRSTMEEVIDGFRYIRADTVIMLILLFTLASTVLGMPFNMLLPMFTEDILKVGEVGLGILIAVSGVGAIVVSLVLASMPNKKRGMIMLFSGLFLGLMLLAFSFTTNWYLSLVLSFFIGTGQTGQIAIGTALVQYYVDPGYRGRVMSFILMGLGLVSLGTFIGGIMADSIGIEWSIGGLAIILVAVSVYMLGFSSQLKKLD